MKRTFVAATMAMSLALTSISAAPAQAGSRDDDLAKFLAGFTALVIIGAALNDRNDRKKHRNKGEVHRLPNPEGHYPRRGAGHRKALPGYCLTHVDTRDGARRLLGGRCLRNNYRQVDRLPNACKRRFETDRGVRRGFSPRCLKRRGFEIAGY